MEPRPEPDERKRDLPLRPLPSGPASGDASVTVVMVARDEESNIEACLSRLCWADRILLVDDGSRDRTVELAGRFTEWIIPGSREIGLDPVHQNLNRAYDLIPEGWILQIDADERVAAALAEETRQVAGERACAAYRIPFRTATSDCWSTWSTVSSWYVAGRAPRGGALPTRRSIRSYLIGERRRGRHSSWRQTG